MNRTPSPICALALLLLIAGCATPPPPVVVDCPRPPPMPVVRPLPPPGSILRSVADELEALDRDMRRWGLTPKEESPKSGN